MNSGVPLVGQVSLGATSAILWNVDSVELPPRSPCEIVGLRQLSSSDERRWDSRVAFEVRRFQKSSSNQIAASGDFRIGAGKPGPGYCGSILPIAQAGTIGTQFRPVAGAFSIASGTGPLLKMDSGTPAIFAADLVQPVQGFILTGSGGGASATANLIDPVDSTVIETGVLIYDPFGATTDQSSGFKGACVFCKDRWIAIGGGGSGGGGGAAEPYCGDVRFEILSVSTQMVDLGGTSVATNVAEVTVLSRPCGCDEVPEEVSGSIAEVFDPMGCHLDEADTAGLVGRQGTAKYRKPVTTLARGDGAFDEGFNFRATEAYVTDEAGETFINNTVLYPPNGWEDATDVGFADVDNTVDRRLAGYNVPTSTGESGTHNTIRFKVDLPEPGKYLISLATGSASPYAEAFQTNVKLYDGATEITYINVALTNGQHADAKGNIHTTAEWPDNHSRLSHEFTTTEFIVELTSDGAYLNHVRIESTTDCWWEIDGLCCVEEAV